MIGAVLHVGTDAGGWQACTFFGGNNVIRELLEQGDIDAKGLMDQLITAIKYVSRLSFYIVD